MMQEYFTIGEISRLYGIGVDSLRYYEKIGVIHPERAPSGYRHYRIEDIWKLNTIRDLRRLGFGMEQIRRYLESRSTASTLQLLEQEQQAIAEKQEQLRQLQKNVEQRLDCIRQAQQKPQEVLRLQAYPERRFFTIPEGYSDESEMDVLIERLINMDKNRLYVIGSNQIGTVIPLPEPFAGEKLRYQAVFVIDDNGDHVLPAGDYLTVCYHGGYGQSRAWVQQMLNWAQSRGLRPAGNILELLWIDIHSTADAGEYVTELQMQIGNG